MMLQPEFELWRNNGKGSDREGIKKTALWFDPHGSHTFWRVLGFSWFSVLENVFRLWKSWKLKLKVWKVMENENFLDS